MLLVGWNNAEKCPTLASVCKQATQIQALPLEKWEEEGKMVRELAGWNATSHPSTCIQSAIYNSGETTSSSIPFPRISTTMCNREQNHRVCYGGSQDVHKYLWGVVLQQCEMNGRTKRRGGGSAGMNSDHLYIQLPTCQGMNNILSLSSSVCLLPDK
jgi:hypothetical protein